jgi:hypothetical protein
MHHNLYEDHEWYDFFVTLSFVLNCVWFIFLFFLWFTAPETSTFETLSVEDVNTCEDTATDVSSEYSLNP